jgi:hypothetical protein
MNVEFEQRFAKVYLSVLIHSDRSTNPVHSPEEYIMYSSTVWGTAEMEKFVLFKETSVANIKLATFMHVTIELWLDGLNRNNNIVCKVLYCN